MRNRKISSLAFPGLLWCLSGPTLAQEEPKRLCRVEHATVRGVSDEYLFKNLEAAREVALKSRQPAIGVRDPFWREIDDADKCELLRYRIGGYHSHAEITLIIFRGFNEWRGGTSWSSLRYCQRTLKRNNFAPEKYQTTYLCGELAKSTLD